MNLPGRLNFVKEFEMEGLRLCLGDIHPGNFLKSSKGLIVVIDFGQTNLLPPSFFLYALTVAVLREPATTDKFAEKLSLIQDLDDPYDHINLMRISMGTGFGLTTTPLVSRFPASSLF